MASTEAHLKILRNGKDKLMNIHSPAGECEWEERSEEDLNDSTE
jgi:hypothetical protein